MPGYRLQVNWLRLWMGDHVTLLYIHHMTRVISCISCDVMISPESLAHSVISESNLIVDTANDSSDEFQCHAPQLGILIRQLIAWQQCIADQPTNRQSEIAPYSIIQPLKYTALCTGCTHLHPGLGPLSLLSSIGWESKYQLSSRVIQHGNGGCKR